MKTEPRDFLRFMQELIPFHVWLGLRIDHVEPGRLLMRLPFRAEIVGDVLRPALHGGAVAALIDAAAGAAAITQIRPVDRASTVDLRIDYLRPAPKADLVADARVIRAGSRISVVNVTVVPDLPEAAPVAEGRGVFAVRRDVGERPEAAADDGGD